MDRPHRANPVAQPKTVSPVSPVALARLVAEVSGPEAPTPPGRYNRTYNRHNR